MTPEKIKAEIREMQETLEEVITSIDEKDPTIMHCMIEMFSDVRNRMDRLTIDCLRPLMDDLSNVAQHNIEQQKDNA